jgi:hypothetical protein
MKGAKKRARSKTSSKRRVKSNRTREDELRELPQWRANKAAWEPGVRTVGLEECLGIDRHGNLYWDGKPVEVRHVWLTRWQKVGAVVIAVSAIVGAPLSTHPS